MNDEDELDERAKVKVKAKEEVKNKGEVIKSIAGSWLKKVADISKDHQDTNHA